MSSVHTTLATLELRRVTPPLSRSSAGFVAAFAGAGAAAALKSIFHGTVSVGTLDVIAAIVGTVVVIALWKRLTRAEERPPIVVTTGDVTFPIRGGRADRRRVPLTDILSIEERDVPNTGLNQELGSKSRAVVVNTARHGLILLNASAFVDETRGPSMLRAGVRQAVGALPDGVVRLATMEARETQGRLFVAAKTRGTWALIAVIAAVFAVALSHRAAVSLDLDHLDHTAFLLRLGGNAPALVERGEWWRLFTANFIHLSWLHIYLNGFALLSLGVLSEKALGTSRFIVVALVAGLCGNVASTLAARGAFSAGASSMLFGLLTALLVVNVLHRGRLPAGLSLSKREWITMIGLNVCISLLPAVDGFAHLGGALGGVAALFTVGTSVSVIPSTTRKRVATVLAASLVALYVVAAVSGLRYGETATTSADDDYFTALMGIDRYGAINDAAWQIAIDYSATPQRLARAEQAARRAVVLAATASADDHAAALDTHAYVLHRVGRVEEALAVERRASWMAPSHPGLHTMLARMLLTRAERSPSHATVAREGNVIVVVGASAGSAAAGVVAYAIVERWRARGTPVGLVRIVFAPGVGSLRANVSGLPADRGSIYKLRVLLADASTDRPEQSPTTHGTYVPLDAQTLALPWH